MLFTTIRIEPPSDRPSAMQTMVNAFTTGLDAAGFGLSLVAPYQFVLAMYRMNRAFTRALFMT